jgi:hypothetical protein
MCAIGSSARGLLYNKGAVVMIALVARKLILSGD